MLSHPVYINELHVHCLHEAYNVYVDEPDRIPIDETDTSLEPLPEEAITLHVASNK